MDAAQVLALYDATIRADPPVEIGVERMWADGVLRTIGAFNFIGWCELAEDDLLPAARREAAFFADRHPRVLWKTYSHDRPAGLGEALAAAGFEDKGMETLVALDLDEYDLPYDPPPGVEVRRITDRAGVVDLVAVSAAAFGRDEPWRVIAFAERLADPTLALYVAYDGGRPVSSGRLELAPGKAFAGLYGGGTDPAHQGRGIYRALVAARVAEARRRGHRYVTVDARETSRPILERLGFQPLSTLRGWLLP
jgi:ribosomal protein S18 acetylase RimI-like enzyme